MADRVVEIFKTLEPSPASFQKVLEDGDRAAAQAKDLSPEEAVEFVMKAAATLGYGRGGAYLNSGMVLDKPVSAVLRRKLPFTPEQILELVRMGANGSYYFPYAQVIRLAAGIAMTPELRSALQTMRRSSALQPGQYLSDVARKLDDLLAGPKAGSEFVAEGPWSQAIAADVTEGWQAVLEAGREISGSEASKKWRVAAGQRVAAIGREQFRETAARWLAIGPTPGHRDQQVCQKEADYQRGLLWSLAEFGDAETCSAVARFAEGCLRKIPMVGAVSQKAANASIKVLAVMESSEAVSQLAKLSMRVKYETAKRLVEEALEEAAAGQGITREELAEITVPDFGLGVEGKRIEVLGEARAELDHEGGLAWFTEDGKPLRSAPERVKRDHADELKELKAAAKEIAAMRGAHRVRIERLLLSQRTIPWERWRACYVEHPLLGNLARTLIWQLETGATGIWREGGLVDWAGADVPPGASVRLWHPLGCDVQTVLSWRCWLQDHQVRQPFKQAHREVYVLTDAERQTLTYSNRFAGHVLKQHPFAALCKERGWTFRLMGEWDSHNTPTLDLPSHGLRIEYRVDFPGDTAASGHGIYLYLSTDQIRFCDVTTGAARELESIPPHVFSEVMRDVDLFTGVTSVGNDPMWGVEERQPFGDYWQRFSFGELSTLAERRKELLTAMVAQLPIRDRCRIEDRFLVVRGDRATYKIHMGSGNVLMEPGSRYLCIVRGPSAAGAPSKVFLPFDGDETLSLILSKAFLLANDKKITDPAISRQLP